MTEIIVGWNEDTAPMDKQTAGEAPWLLQVTGRQLLLQENRVGGGRGGPANVVEEAESRP